MVSAPIKIGRSFDKVLKLLTIDLIEFDVIRNCSLSRTNYKKSWMKWWELESLRDSSVQPFVYFW